MNAVAAKLQNLGWEGPRVETPAAKSKVGKILNGKERFTATEQENVRLENACRNLKLAKIRIRRFFESRRSALYAGSKFPQEDQN